MGNCVTRSWMSERTNSVGAEGTWKNSAYFRYRISLRAVCAGFGYLIVVLGMIELQPAAGEALASPRSQIAEIDLLKPFDTLSPWRFVVTQDAAVFEPVDPALIGSIPKGFTGSEIPGAVHLCLQPGFKTPCDPALVAMPQPPAPFSYSDWEPHYLNTAEVVYPRGRAAPPLLLLQTASLHGGDGNQAVFTQLLRYNRATDRFEEVYAQVTGRNNNQVVRFVVSGPLQGDVIYVEPTIDSPFAYWVTVNALTRGGSYKQVLHYRSATLYNDGNILPVIDSEMPNIERRLGLWRFGMPLPLPSYPCQKPRLSQTELWCG